MDSYIKFLSTYIGENRMAHSIGTAQQAVELAKIYGADEEKAYIAGLLHDIAKGMSAQEQKDLVRELKIDVDDAEMSNSELVHGKLGAAIVSQILGIKDEDILNAISWHTTGREKMSLLEKIVYLADLTEPGRQFENIDVVRELAQKDIDSAMIFALNCVIEFVQCSGFALHPNSKKAQRYLIEEEKNKFELR